jgi:tripartite ATP-independent transporter DctP family solute receptor
MSNKELWIGGYGPEQSAHGRGLATFREHVVRATNGEVNVDITWNIMDLGRPNIDLFELVERGEMFFCYFSSSYLGGRVPELNVTETPYLFRDLDHAHRALDGAMGDALKRAIRSTTGFEALGFWDNGFRHMTNRHRPIHNPQDMEGMTVRMQPNEIHKKLIRSWGAIPVAVDLKPAIEMIAKLEVDAQENPLANTVAYGVHQVHRHVTMTAHLYGTRGLFAHRESFEAMPDDLRGIVIDAVAEAVSTQRKAAADHEDELRRELEAEGLKFVDLSSAQMDEFVRRAAPAIDLAQRRLPEELFRLANV